MIRTQSLLLAVVTSALFACGSSSSNGNPSPDSGDGAVCGDGICAVSEIESCPQDCGSGSGSGSGSQGSGSGSGSGSSSDPCNHNGVCEPSLGETVENCPSDCTGSGSGSGALDCTDETVIEDCILCVTLNECEDGTDVTDCDVCLGD